MTSTPRSSSTSGSLPGANEKQIDIRVARTMADMMQVVAIRSAVYMAEQQAPYEEEFDGNDLCGTQFIGSIGGEPAACLRVRFFAGFVKLERLAVVARFRRTRLAFHIVRRALEHSRHKGYTVAYGHSRKGVDNFWGRFGFKPVEGRPTFCFSDQLYTEMVARLEPHPDPITTKSGPYVIIRPEGEWHRPGVLDLSEIRGGTSPLRDVHAA